MNRNVAKTLSTMIITEQHLNLEDEEEEDDLDEQEDLEEEQEDLLEDEYDDLPPDDLPPPPLPPLGSASIWPKAMQM